MPACTSPDSCFQAPGRGCKPVSLGSCKGISSNSAAMALTNIRKLSHCVFGCKPIGILPELHYVIHVRPPKFVFRLHKCELGAKPAQLDTAFQHMSQSEEQSDPQSHSQSDPQPHAQPHPQSDPQAHPQAHPQARPQSDPQPNPCPTPSHTPSYPPSLTLSLRLGHNPSLGPNLLPSPSFALQLLSCNLSRK